MRPLPLALAVAACLAVPGTAAAQTLNGFVNADQTIGLTQGGTAVTQLAGLTTCALAVGALLLLVRVLDGRPAAEARLESRPQEVSR